MRAINPLRTIELVTAVLVQFNFVSVTCNYFLVDKPVFVRSGYIYLPGIANTLRSLGHYATYWSSYSDALGIAYNFLLDINGVYPSRGPNHDWHGFPLRCLSTVLDI